MKVTLVASTGIVKEPEQYISHLTEDLSSETSTWLDDFDDPYVHMPQEMDEMGEIAGRLCYLSWKRPNPATATNEGYLRNIIKQQHFSVLEHSSVTYLLEDVSRSFTHELVRHRHLSFSQVSQRYVDESDFTFVVPPALTNASTKVMSAVDDLITQAKKTYGIISEELMKEGLSKKEVRQSARSVLPNGTATAILVSGNLRSWREFFQKRISPGADAEIRTVAQEMLVQLHSYAPNSLQDLDDLLPENL